MMRRYIFLTIAFFSLFHVASAQKKKGRTPEKEINIPEGLTYQVIQYREDAKTPKRANQLGISYKDDGQKKKPVVVFIHGGGWANGDKDNVLYQVFNVAKQGFVGVTISYRLVSEGDFPVCIEDVKEAIRCLKSKEGELPLDLDRIGIWGYSAGAHLSLMIGLSPEDTFHSGTYTDYDCKVKTIMPVSTPTDFVIKPEREWFPKFLNEEQVADIAFQQSVSPTHYVHQGQPKIFMIHGTADKIVPSYHYLNFKKVCEEKGINNFTLYEIEEGGHMLYFKRRQDVMPLFKEFLKEVKSQNI
ncbi:alpha/beta hydrolase [Flammeovirga sp. SubArs3]|uniref:alpha/beta hydrolase n=1 Tax=Flammeovirga sp. SubArs3 TaxID=2995316 RepID=UPI00248B44F4|nr:alpha/beta hydrolase [Flammeovirga sp. SubArs3]